MKTQAYVFLFFSTTLLFAADTEVRRDSLSTTVSAASYASTEEGVKLTLSRDGLNKLACLREQLVAASEAGNKAAATCLSALPAELLVENKREFPTDLTVVVSKESLDAVKKASQELSRSLEAHNKRQLKVSVCCGSSAVCVFLPLTVLTAYFLASGSYGGVTEYSFLLAALIFAPVLLCCTCCSAVQSKKKTLHVSVENFALLNQEEIV